MQQTREHSREPLSALRLLPVGGLAAAVLGLMMDVNYIDSVKPLLNTFVQQNSKTETCQGDINRNVIVSREQLAAFLTISERDSKNRVQEVLQTPYCYLSNLEIRAGVQAERAVYPLAFDPKTWLVVLYEGEEYAGYQFQLFNQN
jgi:hypothetical protein